MTVGPATDRRSAVAGFTAVLQRAEFLSELSRLATTEWQWGEPLAVRSTVCKAHRQRCTFELAVRTELGCHAVIAKVHHQDRSDVYQTMQTLHRAGFDPAARFSIPRPLHYIPSLHVLLEEKVPGQQAMNVFLDPACPEHDTAADLSGEWLAHFHDTAPPLGRVTSHDHLWPSIHRWVEDVVRAGAPLATKGERLVRRLEASTPPADAAAFRTGHGSYIAEHVMLGGPRTSVIDFDECDIADPARDLAWFVVLLQRLTLKQGRSLHALDAQAKRFLRSYVNASHAGASATANLPFYRGAECLHRASSDLVKRRPPMLQWSEAMLDEGLRVC
jgi:aminoglycoside phosphotransferase (APT) family kinase protein